MFEKAIGYICAVQGLIWIDAFTGQVIPPPPPLRVVLAQEILRRHYNLVNGLPGPHIYLREWSGNMTYANRRSSYANMVDTANGLMATTRDRLNNGTPVPNTFITEELLKAILFISDNYYSIIINQIAGGNHTQQLIDEHYNGRALDFRASGGAWSNLVGGYVSNNITFANRQYIIDLLENNGFITQQSRDPNIHVGLNLVGYIGGLPWADGASFHLSIFEPTCYCKQSD